MNRTEWSGGAAGETIEMACNGRQSFSARLSDLAGVIEDGGNVDDVRRRRFHDIEQESVEGTIGRVLFKSLLNDITANSDGRREVIKGEEHFLVPLRLEPWLPFPPAEKRTVIVAVEQGRPTFDDILG
jgi:hypothetical protein